MNFFMRCFPALILIFLLWSPHSLASILDFKNDKDIFPVPVFETRPDEGQTYGLMPILLLSDPKSGAIESILGLVGQYNSVTKIGGAVLAYFYPKPDAEILVYGEMAQRFYREASFRFFDPHFTKKIYLEFDFLYLKSPFGRFYGLGPGTIESNQSNYTSRNFLIDFNPGYYLHKNFRINYALSFHTTDLLSRGISSIADTLTLYGGVPQVVDSTNFISGPTFTFDNRPEREYSEHGTLAQLATSFSHKSLGSDFSFFRWKLETVHLLPVIKDRLTWAFQFVFQDVINDAPFYELSALGGDVELRAFTPNRFVDQGKILFQFENRIRLFTMKVFGITCKAHLDPFIGVGRVFDDVDHLGFARWQPVGGLGLRLFVPPNVLARLDLGVGSDGYEIYTQLGYPF